MTLVELQTKRDSILAEIAKGNLRLESPSGSITKRAMDELKTALAIVDNEIQKVSSTSTGNVGRIYSMEGL